MSYNKALTAPVMTWESGEAFACFIESIGDDAVGEIGFDMKNEHQVAHHSDHPCGTAMCIGGWCALAIPKDEREYVGIATAACRVLGIEPDEAYDLCYPAFSEDGDINKITYESVRGVHAAKAIRNTMAHGDPKWIEIMADDISKAQECV